MKIICDSCQTKYSIADEKVRGKVFKIKCKKCSHVIVVRGTAADDAVAAQPDEKETKVFDYSGYEDARQALAAAEAGDAIWHMVIDQEQVGPITAAELHAKLAAGEIDADTYVWREGFSDWARLAEVEELARASGAGPMPRGAAYAGSPAGDADAFSGATLASESEVGDLFAARGELRTADPAGDLFGGGDAYEQPMAAGSDDRAGLFGGGGAAAGTASPGTGGLDVGAQLTGQRNENSVLFSLSNLASLASDAPKAAPQAPAGGVGMAQAGGQEGSGLIDIRSMAAVYLGDQHKAAGGPAARGAAPDDLPVFGGGFDAGAQVLLPTASADGDKNKLLYVAIGLLSLVAAVLLAIVVRGGGEPQPPPTVAAAGGRAAGAPPAEPAAGSAQPAPPAPAAAAADEPSGDDPGSAAAAAPPAAADERNDDEAPAREAASAEVSREPKSTRRTSSSSPRRERTASRPTERESAQAAAPRPSSEKCDEVACLVDPSLPCCGKSGGSSAPRRDSGNSSSADSDLPERPGRTDVSAGIGKVRGRVQSCGDKYSFTGTVTVKLAIAPTGKVTSASADKGTGPFQSCVTDAVSNAKFPQSQKGVTVNYPFVVR
jgi:predicted Zn finger-like uncharacterized protein